MSEEETKEIKEEEQIEGDVVEDSYSVMRAQVIFLTDENERLKAENEDLKKKNKKQTDLLEDEVKGKLIAKIAPLTDEPKHLLALKSIDELKLMEKILTKARVPAFKSGTPLIPKNDPKVKLDNMYVNYMKKIGAKD